MGRVQLGRYGRGGEIVAVPNSIEVLWLLALGYPDITPVDRPRKPVEEFVRYETWETG